MKPETLRRKAEQFRERFEAELGNEWEMLTEYKGGHEPLTARHIPCGEIRTAEAKKFFTSGCRTCQRAKAARDRADKRSADYIRQIESKYNVTSLSAYNGPRAAHLWRCNLCGAVIERPIEYILFRGNGYGGGMQCECQKPPNYAPLIRVLKKHLARRVAVEVRRKRLEDEIHALCAEYARNGYETLHIDDDLQRVTLKHIKCGRVYTTRKASMKEGHGCRECSRCGTSYGVQQIEQYMRDNDILFDREVTFPTCKRERVLPFDFAVYDHEGNLDYLIEYQGEQHYRARPMFGGEEKLQRVQEADAIKKKWAKDNGIELLVIDWNEDVITKLERTGSFW